VPAVRERENPPRHAQPMKALWEIHMLTSRLGVAPGGLLKTRQGIAGLFFHG
jgi:hypothetical protein